MIWFLSIIEVGGYVFEIDEWTDGLQSHPAHLLQNTTKLLQLYWILYEV